MNSSTKKWIPEPYNSTIEIIPHYKNVIPSILGKHLIGEWNKVKYEPKASAKILESLIKKFNFPENFFNVNNIMDGKVWVTKDMLFSVPDHNKPQKLTITLKNHLDRPSSFNLEAPLEYIVEFLEEGSDSNIYQALCTQANFNKYITNPIETTDWPSIKEQGLYRREHASVLIKSKEASIVLDPQRLASGWTTNSGKYRKDPAPLNLDAALITHSHNDHWHFPTLVNLSPNREMSVIIPICPVRNILSHVDMKYELEQANINTVEMEWWTRKKIGDIEIVALPFYGEQPSSTLEPIHPDLRMWGNCYRINVNEYSILFLVDSGKDFMGDMIQVIEQSVEEDGEIDIVLNCISEFEEIINNGLPHYIFTQPFSAIKETYERKEKRSMTLGVKGAAAACKAAKAKYYLPYANGFSPERMESEKESLKILHKLLEDLGTKTKIVDWEYGDFYPLQGNS